MSVAAIRDSEERFAGGDRAGVDRKPGHGWRQGTLPPSVSGLSIDTRTIAAGEAFFAIADRRDGHEFVPAALAAQAGLAVVAAERRSEFAKDKPLLVVPDVLAGLRDLAK